MPFFRCSKILGEGGEQEIFNKCPKIRDLKVVFRTDIFQKLTLGTTDQDHEISSLV